jgi:hypothetical protein
MNVSNWAGQILVYVAELVLKNDVVN